MGFSTGSSSTLATSSDVSFSNLLAGQVLTYDVTTQKWKNVAASSTAITAAKDILTAGSLNMIAGTTPVLTKFAGSLAANRTITLSAAAANYYFEFSFIDASFNGFTVTITNGTFSHVFSYPTYVKYVSIAGIWERII